MNACCNTMPVTIPLHRPLWERITLRFAEAWRQWSSRHDKGLQAMNLREAMALNDHLLRDIGVSEALRDEAAVRRGLDSMAAHVAQGDLAGRGRNWYG